MSKNRNHLMSTLNDVIHQFMIIRITTTVEKKLCKNRKYQDFEEKAFRLEDQILNSLTQKQKEAFVQYSDILVELNCIREESVYRQGMIDAFRIEDIIKGAC